MWYGQRICNVMKRFRVLTALLLMLMMQAAFAAHQPSDKVVTIKGKIYRSDTKDIVSHAVITLLDEKNEKKDNSVETKTDKQGQYVLENVKEGKYTVSIQAWYPKQEDVPCQLLAAKTEDQNSAVLVVQDGDKFMQQVFIKGFSVKAGKEIVKDFDFACKSLFEK